MSVRPVKRFQPCAANIHLSRDPTYRSVFSSEVRRQNPVLSYDGYRRAIELYGCEPNLLAKETAGHFSRWSQNNRTTHAAFRSQAIADGYNPDFGTSAPWQGVHFPSGDLTDYPTFELLEESNGLFTVRETPSTTSRPPQTPSRLPPVPEEPNTDSEPDLPTVGGITMSAKRNERGQFTSEKNATTDWFEGNVHPKDGEDKKNALGLAESAHVLAEALHKVINSRNNRVIAEAKKVLADLGGQDAFKDEWLPWARDRANRGFNTPIKPLFGSALRESRHNSIDLTGDDGVQLFGSIKTETSPLKRPAEPANPLAILSKARLINVATKHQAPKIPDTPVIIEDSIAQDAGSIPVYWLVVSNQAMLFGLAECANLFGVAVKLIRDEAKKPFSLAETAKAMGIATSLVVTFDMPLMKPVASSTSAASLYAAIQEHEVFTNEEAASNHLVKAHEFFKNAKYNISAHMKPVATRTLTEPAEAWVPALPVAKLATFRGKDWVPFAEVETEDGETVAQPRLITNDEVSSMTWDSYTKGPGDANEPGA
ncbi:hypothetical protein N0V84_012654 [Fusarium piperis]|uniref:Uncharacterized protein n=1 Tax=Fusarium piperis TaxID=1435070 RepID=A0A9W8W250_9HYPO|nr:hypothetical protein N0V84_012654 [Fusarium piperis]